MLVEYSSFLYQTKLCPVTGKTGKILPGESKTQTVFRYDRFLVVASMALVLIAMVLLSSKPFYKPPLIGALIIVGIVSAQVGFALFHMTVGVAPMVLLGALLAVAFIAGIFQEWEKRFIFSLGILHIIAMVMVMPLH